MGEALRERIENLGETCGQTLGIGYATQRAMGSLQNEVQETHRPAIAHAAFHLAEPTKGKLNE